MAIVTKAAVGCALLAAVTVAGCGTLIPAARTTAAPPSRTTTTTTTRATSGPDPMIGQWIGQYCTSVLMDAETYAGAFAEAAAAMPTQGQSDAQANVQELAQIASSIDASIENDVTQVTNGNPTTPAATGARTYLLNTYQNLHNALTTAKSQLGTISTADLQQFNTAFNTIAANVSAAVRQSQSAIDSYPAFAIPLRNNVNCK